MKFLILILCFVSMLNNSASAQVLKPTNDDDKIWTVVAERAEFPGGEAAMMQYLAQNIKYPKKAQRKGVTGKVFIECIVELDGSITNVVIKRNIGAGCGEEAKRVIEAMPKWIPAKQDGKNVRFRCTLPIVFSLE